MNITKRLYDNQPKERPKRCVARGNGAMRGGGASRWETVVGGAPAAAVAGHRGSGGRCIGFGDMTC